MVVRTLALAAATAGILLAASASAQDGAAVRVAHDALASGDYARAERVLAAEQRIFPGSPEVLVNLAAVYARTGRVQQAAALYRNVLLREDVLLDLSADRAVSSHVLAETGLHRIGTLQTAAR